MSADDNKRVVAEFVERCQNQHDLAYADEAFHPGFVNHYRPEGQSVPETDRRQETAWNSSSSTSSGSKTAG